MFFSFTFRFFSASWRLKREALDFEYDKNFFFKFVLLVCFFLCFLLASLTWCNCNWCRGTISCHFVLSSFHNSREWNDTYQFQCSPCVSDWRYLMIGIFFYSENWLSDLLSLSFASETPWWNHLTCPVWMGIMKRMNWTKERKERFA